MSGFESERIIKIINAVRKHECLWNVTSSEYGKRDKLERAWNEVAQEVSKSDVFCREKWRNVRTGFLRSIQHQIRGTNSEETSTMPSDFHHLKRKRFYLYDQMSFLLPSAETLEQTRKKRKLSRDRKTILETDDADGEASIQPEYNLVNKFEPRDENEEECENESEEVELHTLLINGEVYTENEEDNSVTNIEEILKEVEHGRIFNPTKSKKRNPNDKATPQPSSSLNSDSIAIDASTDVVHSPTTTKVIRTIVEQMNDELSSKSSENMATSETIPTEQISNNHHQFSQREEQQLLSFFRGCIDDILSLNNQKRRLFKKRMLDVIDELHNL